MVCIEIAPSVFFRIWLHTTDPHRSASGSLHRNCLTITELMIGNRFNKTKVTGAKANSLPKLAICKLNSRPGLADHRCKLGATEYHAEVDFRSNQI